MALLARVLLRRQLVAEKYAVLTQFPRVWGVMTNALSVVAGDRDEKPLRAPRRHILSNAITDPNADERAEDRDAPSSSDFGRRLHALGNERVCKRLDQEADDQASEADLGVRPILGLGNAERRERVACYRDPPRDFLRRPVDPSRKCPGARDFKADSGRGEV